MPDTTPAFNPAEMDRIAKARGYRNYAHMIMVMQNGLPRPKAPPSTQRAGNFLQNLWNSPADTLSDAFQWHPKQTIQRAAEVLRQARGE